MAGARPIADLDCKDSLGRAARSVVAVRLDEVLERRQLILGPEDPMALHDLRIAAKRLRYSLEMFDLCFPQGRAESYADGVRALQDVLGRMHDLDVLHDLLAERLERLDEARRERELRAAADLPAGETRELIRKALRDGRSESARLGILEIVAAKSKERRECYQRFVELWSEWEESGFLQGIRDMLDQVEEAPRAG